jgi:hypothetical protein
VNCPKCKTQNHDEKKYCGDCGTLLKSDVGLFSPEVRDYVRSIIKEELRDQKAVEIEITEAIVTRVTSWAKLFALAAGLLVTIFLGILGVLGFGTFSEFKHRIEVAKNQIDPILNKADADTKAISLKIDELNIRAKEVAVNLEQANERSHNATTDLVRFYQAVNKQSPELISKLKPFTRDFPPDTKNALDIIVNSAKVDPGNGSSLPLVYIQFQGSIKRDLLESLKQDLNSANLPALGVERVPGNYHSEVRYFYDDDVNAAKKVLQNTEAFFRQHNCGLELQLVPLLSNPTAKKRQVEVWINQNCIGNT